MLPRLPFEHEGTFCLYSWSNSVNFTIFCLIAYKLIYRLDSLLYFRSNGELRLSDYYWLTTYNESNNDQYPQCKWAEEDGKLFQKNDEIFMIRQYWLLRS